jgi:dolichol kinase
MEPTLVLETKSFAIRLFNLLRELDPVRKQTTRKQVLKARIMKLEAEVNGLYSRMQALSHELETPSGQMSATLRQVGDLLTELNGIDIDSHLSYLSLYSLRNRLLKAYQRLSVMMEALAMPIPHLRPSNVARSLFHCTSAVAILLMIEFVPAFSWMFWIALAYFIFCWGTEGLKRLGPETKARVMKLFALIAHPHEYDKINSATWYGVALLLMSLMPTPVLGIIAIAILGFADPAAALVGRRYGSIKLPGNRTLEGSIGFFVTGTLAASAALAVFHPIGGLGTTLFVAASASLLGALGELAGKWPDDNLTIPMASAAGAFGALSLLSMI